MIRALRRRHDDRPFDATAGGRDRARAVGERRSGRADVID